MDVKLIEIHIRTQKSFLSTLNFGENKDLISSTQMKLIKYPPTIVYGRQKYWLFLFQSTDSFKLLLEKVNQLFQGNFNGRIIYKHNDESGLNQMGVHYQRK